MWEYSIGREKLQTFFVGPGLLCYNIGLITGREVTIMDRAFTWQIPPEEEGQEIRRFLRARGFSRQCLIRLKKEADNVAVDGVPCFLTRTLQAGETLSVLLREESSSEKILPADLPLHICYEDEDLIVLDKPAGMPIHPSMNQYNNSLANALARYYAAQGGNFVFRCVNRLDRDTSGLTIVGKNLYAASVLSAMVMKRQIHREYRAIVRGQIDPASGTIDMPLGRKPGSIIERVIDPVHGERAVTHYRVLSESNGHSLVALELETGRTHQIRIHMKYLGYPLIGDYLYNPDMEWIGRQALHSCRLTFPHPVSGQLLEFTSPLPEDMQNVLSGVRPPAIP